MFTIHDSVLHSLIHVQPNCLCWRTVALTSLWIETPPLCFYLVGDFQHSQRSPSIAANIPPHLGHQSLCCLPLEADALQISKSLWRSKTFRQGLINSAALCSVSGSWVRRETSQITRGHSSFKQAAALPLQPLKRPRRGFIVSEVTLQQPHTHQNSIYERNID